MFANSLIRSKTAVFFVSLAGCLLFGDMRHRRVALGCRYWVVGSVLYCNYFHCSRPAELEVGVVAVLKSSRVVVAVVTEVVAVALLVEPVEVAAVVAAAFVEVEEIWLGVAVELGFLSANVSIQLFYKIQYRIPGKKSTHFGQGRWPRIGIKPHILRN